MLAWLGEFVKGLFKGKENQQWGKGNINIHTGGAGNVHIGDSHGVASSANSVLVDMRAQAEEWFNEITTSLKPLLLDLHNGTATAKAHEYAMIAGELYWNKIESNNGNQLKNSRDQMMNMAPFSGREEVDHLAIILLQMGHFLKDANGELNQWERYSANKRDSVRAEIGKRWEGFRDSKENLVKELNRQIGRLS